LKQNYKENHVLNIAEAPDVSEYEKQQVFYYFYLTIFIHYLINSIIEIFFSLFVIRVVICLSKSSLLVTWGGHSNTLFSFRGGGGGFLPNKN
jgi:hypothetical protein